MTNGNQTPTRFKDEIGIVPNWVFILAAVLALGLTGLLVCVMGMDRHAPAFPVRVCCSRPHGNRDQLLHRTHWLREPGCGTAPDEPHAVDADCRLRLPTVSESSSILSCASRVSRTVRNVMSRSNPASASVRGAAPACTRASALPAQRERWRQVLSILVGGGAGSCISSRSGVECLKQSNNHHPSSHHPNSRRTTSVR